MNYYDLDALNILGEQNAENSFPDPFRTIMALNMPRTMTNALRWAERVWFREGIYSQACRRIVKFFLTELQITGVDEAESTRWSDYLTRTYDIFNQLSVIGEDRMCYGNSFCSQRIPFRRFLVCPRCRLERPISKTPFAFSQRKFTIRGKCQCGHAGELLRVDRPSRDERQVRPIRWNPHHMRIRWNPVTHDVRYLYRFPSDVQDAVRRGDQFIMETMPWEFIVAMLDNKDFEFFPWAIYHIKEETLAGVRNMGWGLPPSLPLLHKIYQVQVFNRYDEALALDYVMPMRFITPKAGSSRMADPLQTLDLGSFTAQMQWRIRQHRRDPADWMITPFPLEYSVYGGEARNMSPFELKNIAIDDLLNSSGVPAELYKLSLQTQSAPLALRVFTQLWSSWLAAINGWLEWTADSIATAFHWDRPDITMKPPTMADDIELRQIQLQLAAAQRMSMTTAMAGIGSDYKRELDQMYDDKRREMQKQRELQEEMSAQQLQDGMNLSQPSVPAQGGPAGTLPAGPLADATPQDMSEMADQMAQQMLDPGVSYAQRRRMLQQLKHTHETLYAMVKDRMSRIRSDAESAGREMLMQGG